MKRASSGVRGVFEKPPGSGIWWIRFQDQNGRIQRKKIGTKSAAEETAEAARTAVRKGEFIPEKSKRRLVSFAEIAADCLDYSKAHKRSYQDDVYRMGRLLEWFREQPAEAITARDVERHFEQEEWSPATVNRYRALLSLTYRLAIRNAKAKENPARSVAHRLEDNGRTRFLSPEEEVGLRAAIRAIGPEHLAEFDLALNTGLRLSEQYGLRWENVNLERRVVEVARSKNGSSRHVRLNQAALRAITALRAVANGSEFVCGGAKEPRRWFEPAVRAAGLENFSWHCLRHTTASRLVMSGADLRTVAELLGHKTLQMVMRYSHLAPDFQLAAVERMGAVFPKPTDTATDTSGLVRLEREVAHVN